MPQTRFVLKKALEAGLTAIVVVNKIDKPAARPKEVVDEVMDLFIELGASIDQLDFPVVYASGLVGTSSYSPDSEDQKPTMDPILDTILAHIPDPVEDDADGLQFQPALLDYSDFVGRIGLGVVKRGTVKVNEMVSCIRLDGSIKQFRIQKMFGYYGYKRIEIETAEAGDIIAIAGLPDISVGETICTIGKEEALPHLRIDEPTLQMTFGVNSSPFCGKEGKLLTASKIEDRRREGFELQVSKPNVIVKVIDGVKCEPYEDLQIDVPEEYVGNVITALGNRDAEMINMANHGSQTRLNYLIPSRGLIGFTTAFMTMTKGYGIMNHSYNSYKKMATGQVGERKVGVLVSMENGKSTAYAIGALEDRGVMFIEPGTDVYEGMIVGEHNHENDLAVNVVKGKKLTNTRAAGSDHTVVLNRPRTMTLEV